MKSVDHSTHQPDWEDIKARRWIRSHVCISAFDVRGRVVCQSKAEYHHRHVSTLYSTRVLCMFFAQWGFLSTELSIFCCVSSGVGVHAYSWGPRVFSKSLVLVQRGRLCVRRWGDSLLRCRFLGEICGWLCQSGLLKSAGVHFSVSFDEVIAISPVLMFPACAVIISALHLNPHANTTRLCWKPAPSPWFINK